MDANVPVFMVLFKTLSKLNLQMMVQCQPSVPNNPIFTDFIVCMDEEGLPKLVIEVKKSTFHPALILKSQEVAQVIGEVYVLSMEKELIFLPFVLTNGLGWNFGVSKTVGTKLEISVDENLLFSTRDILHHLIYYLTVYCYTNYIMNLSYGKPLDERHRR